MQYVVPLQVPWHCLLLSGLCFEGVGFHLEIVQAFLNAVGLRLHLTELHLRGAGPLLQEAGLPGHRLRAAEIALQTAGQRLQAARMQLQAAGSLLPAAGAYLLPAAGAYLLPAAGASLLPAARDLYRSARGLLLQRRLFQLSRVLGSL